MNRWGLIVLIALAVVGLLALMAAGNLGAFK